MGYLTPEARPLIDCMLLGRISFFDSSRAQGTDHMHVHMMLCAHICPLRCSAACTILNACRECSFLFAVWISLYLHLNTQLGRCLVEAVVNVTSSANVFKLPTSMLTSPDTRCHPQVRQALAQGFVSSPTTRSVGMSLDATLKSSSYRAALYGLSKC